MNSCPALPEHFKTQECGNFQPTIKKLIMRVKKNGQVQIKINGKGKWIDAEYNEERKTVTYLS